MNSARRTAVAAFAFAALLAASATPPSTSSAPQRGGGRTWQPMRSDNVADWHESERSDKFTGGSIERARFEAGEPDIRITVNVPSFRLTLWQNGREVKSYFVGVGMKDYPIVIGERQAREVIWNPSWIPPSSDWVRESGVRPGRAIPPGSKANPLGKLKIPLGGGYLIHQAKGTGDLGNLVSHGCIRMMRADLYDLAEKIVAARSLPVTKQQIARAKAGTKTLAVALDPPVPVDINYDTAVVEGGTLHLYPDVYPDRRNATVERLRAELISSGVDESRLDEETLREMLSRVTRRTQFVVPVAAVESGRVFEESRSRPLVGRPDAPPRRTAVRRRTVTRVRT
ncbi:MAG TPA: L,D-transpeptidase [Pyrinomonadaceae bacterium]|nr:L,D-transpeptidase [Pyrinomonadaceae bacterium]